ncbi:MAG: hypothetical protein JO352_17620 [Chloroflexi bacterium]|nr:hypothetical protein [Chloroflexota bacterium]
MDASLPPRADPSIEAAVGQARAALARFGLLLFSDPALPSLVGVIVDEPLRSSWWGHPRGHVIYAAMNRLEDDPDVLSSKLIAGKVTYVHRNLWPAVYAAGTGREAWQLNNLSAGARWLLEETDAHGAVQTDMAVPPREVRADKRTADFARELERRVLVHATEFHTPSGAHAKLLETWQRWAATVKFRPPALSAAEARAELEAAAARLPADGALVRLPWRR